VDVVRISPQSLNTIPVIAAFDAVRRGALPALEALRNLEPLQPAASCNGYWYGKPGLDYFKEKAA